MCADSHSVHSGEDFTSVTDVSVAPALYHPFGASGNRKESNTRTRIITAAGRKILVNECDDGGDLLSVPRSRASAMKRETPSGE